MDCQSDLVCSIALGWTPKNKVSYDTFLWSCAHEHKPWNTSRRRETRDARGATSNSNDVCPAAAFKSSDLRKARSDSVESGLLRKPCFLSLSEAKGGYKGNWMAGGMATLACNVHPRRGNDAAHNNDCNDSYRRNKIELSYLIVI